ncbi:hypothetical protein BDC45DRAFT_533790 [Circinella umbellata]|nr:hypothetical protein BDC45DRAFT_533790 [Circinella umbellata]
MKSIVAAIAALAIAAVSAQDTKPIVSITAPLSGTKLKAGSDAIITWINPTVDSISKIMLAKGEATALQPLVEVASNVDAKAGTYTWKIPADIAPGADYAFELGESPNMAFAGHFTIEGGDGSSPNSTASASGGASVSASASSKPSGSADSSASGSSGSGSSGSKPTSSASASGAEESVDESSAVKMTVAPVALALAGAVAAGLL